MIDKSDDNVMNVYIDALMKADPTLSGKDAMRSWLKKKYYPAKGGLVKYDENDLIYCSQ